jgi:hypothetical protein
MGIGSLPGVKRPERCVKHPPPSAKVKERVELYLFMAGYTVKSTLYNNNNNSSVFTILATLEGLFRLTLCCHGSFTNVLTPVLLFVCRIEEAAPILTGESTHTKLKSGTSHTPINNKNGFVSTDVLHQESKKTLQGLLPQVKHRPRGAGQVETRPRCPTLVHFGLIFYSDHSLPWHGTSRSPAHKNSTIWHPKIIPVFKTYHV